MTTNITPNCTWCGKHEPSGLATITAVAIDGEDGIEMRAVNRGGVAYTGPVADDLDAAADLLGTPTVSDFFTNAQIWADTDDPDAMLRDLAEVWHAARDAERIAAAAAYAAIRHAAAAGMTEVRIASLLDIDRMTVRRALGKR